MRYIPVTNKNRKYCGKYWTPRYLRSIHFSSSMGPSVAVDTSKVKNLLAKEIE